MSRWNVVALAALLGCVVCLPASAQWKWRDKAGQTQYSDLPPPPGVADQDILQRPISGTPARNTAAPVASPASGASGVAGAPLLVPSKNSDPELEAKRKKAEQDVADKKKADDAKVAATKADNCARARASLRTIDSGLRMARTNEKGEREILDDSARADEARRTRDLIANECK